jgi:hypothetical protein
MDERRVVVAIGPANDVAAVSNWELRHEVY